MYHDYDYDYECDYDADYEYNYDYDYAYIITMTMPLTMIMIMPISMTMTMIIPSSMDSYKIMVDATYIDISSQTILPGDGNGGSCYAGREKVLQWEYGLNGRWGLVGLSIIQCVTLFAAPWTADTTRPAA